MTPLSTFLDGRPPNRGALWLALSETGYILRHAGTTDGGGGWIEAYGTAGTVPCRVDALSGAATRGGGAVAAKISDNSTHVVTVPNDTEINPDDDFEVKDRGRFEVTAIRVTTGEHVTQFEVTDQTA